MKHFLPSGAIFAALALMPACTGKMGQPWQADGIQRTIYSPTEAGLLLLFESAAPETENGIYGRLQLLVLQAEQTPQGLLVACSASTLRGAGSVAYLCQPDGGVFTVGQDGSKAMLLPPGFPGETAEWHADGISYQVIGRAKADIPGVKFPSRTGSIGVWVEAAPDSPQSSVLGHGRARFFFLPGIGEAEAKVYSRGGWATASRLAGIGFADAP